MSTCRLLAVVLFCIPATARVGSAAPNARVQLDLTGPAVPYASVESVIEARDDAVVISVTKTFSGRFGHRATVGLLPEGAANPLVQQLRALGFDSLKSHETARHRVRYTLTVDDGLRSKRLVIDDPEILEDGRYLQVIRTVQGIVEANTDEIPFEDALLLTTEFGRLRVAATPAGRVEVNGLRIPGRTPHAGIRLEAGAHRVTITPIEGGPQYEYDVKVRVGRTTSLVVELK